MTDVSARCHCGAIEIVFAAAPVELVHCNCSLCRSYGVLWAYPDAGEIEIRPTTPATDTYAWNGRNVDFHRCKTCGCLTHWIPRDATRTGRGVNAHLLPPEIVQAAKITRRDGAGTGVFTE